MIHIDVPDLERAIQFEAAIGLRLSRGLFRNSVAEMVSSLSIYLIVKPENSVPIAGPGRAAPMAWTHYPTL
jgi:hypothetical protein